MLKKDTGAKQVGKCPVFDVIHLPFSTPPPTEIIKKCQFINLPIVSLSLLSMILELRTYFNFLRLNRFLFIEGINSKF